MDTSDASYVASRTSQVHLQKVAIDHGFFQPWFLFIAASCAARFQASAWLKDEDPINQVPGAGPSSFFKGKSELSKRSGVWLKTIYNIFVDYFLSICQSKRLSQVVNFHKSPIEKLCLMLLHFRIFPVTVAMLES